MARTKLNLNRFRKIYPQLRRSPFFWYKQQEPILLETIQGTCTAGSYSFTTTESFNSIVVVATAEDNVNVWVSSTQRNGDGTYDITVQTSDGEYSGVVHVHMGEASV